MSLADEVKTYSQLIRPSNGKLKTNYRRTWKKREKSILNIEVITMLSEDKRCKYQEQMVGLP